METTTTASHNDPARPAFGFVPTTDVWSRASAAYDRARDATNSAAFRLALDAVADQPSAQGHKAAFHRARAAEKYAAAVSDQAWQTVAISAPAGAA